MRHLAAGLALTTALQISLLIATPANAQNAELADPDTTCTLFGDLADQVMDARQLNLPMSQTMAIFSSSYEGSFLESAKRLILAAYEEPYFSTETIRQTQKSNFRNTEELTCYKALANR